MPEEKSGLSPVAPAAAVVGEVTGLPAGVRASEPALSDGRRRRQVNFSWIALAILLIAFWATSPGFYSKNTWLAVSLYASEIIPLATGQLLVVLTGGIDLSDGATLGLSGMTSGVLMVVMWNGGHGAPAGLTIALGVIVALATGAGVGLLNGILVGSLRLPPFIVTLGTLGMVGAAINLVNNGQSAVGIPPAIANFGSTYLGGWMPVTFLVAAVLMIVVGGVLAFTKFGWHIYVVGSNPVAARRSGIVVTRTLLAAYVISGILAAVSGLLVMARFGEGSNAAGANDELTAIAAVVIGGASLFGGRGTMLGAAVGTAILCILTSGFVLAGLVPFWQPFATGGVVILAVTFDTLQGRGRGRRSRWVAYLQRLRGAKAAEGG